MPAYTCDVAVIGGGMGGVAAALAAVDMGATVILTEATDWIGGQMTSQGVSALDEHPHIEQFGGTRTYYQMREAIRAHYRERYNAPATMPDGAPLNPGNGWVSRLCFEPHVGVMVLEAMLAPHVATGRLTILREHTPIAATVDSDRVIDVTLQHSSGQHCAVEASYVLDATELGDLLPLVGAEYVTGAEAQSDTGEPHASRDGAHPDETQGFTFCFALEHRPGEDHTIAKPKDYELRRDRQPYTFTLTGHGGETLPFRMFTRSPDGMLPFWTYRRIVDGALLDPNGTTRDIALINWPGNDYHGANIIDTSLAEHARIIDEAKQLALGFLFWLQTEAPHDDGQERGYPGLCLLPDVMSTADGLSKAPYIRESRRIVARKRIVEQEIAAAQRTGARAAFFPDSVGIGWYHMDLHDCVGRPTSMYAPTLPFQIPLGALLPRQITNLIAACKNIGTTHLTNGAYRLHPSEWNIGEAAGALAAWCCTVQCSPHDVYVDPALLRQFQRQLLERGVPLAWTVDLPASDPLFVPAQLLVLAGAIGEHSGRFHSLTLALDHALRGSDMLGLLRAVQRLSPAIELPPAPRWTMQEADVATWDDVAHVLEAIGAEPPVFHDPPTWRDVCGALAPLVYRATSPFGTPPSDTCS